MESVAQALLDELEKNREALRNDPAALRAVVDQHLLPHFDTDYAGQLVLGKHWRQATPAQRKRFVDAFYQSLMRNYGEAFWKKKKKTPSKQALRDYRGSTLRMTELLTQMVKQNRSKADIEAVLRKEFGFQDFHIMMSLDGLINEMR